MEEGQKLSFWRKNFTNCHDIVNGNEEQRVEEGEGSLTLKGFALSNSPSDILFDT